MKKKLPCGSMINYPIVGDDVNDENAFIKVKKSNWIVFWMK